MTIAPTDNRQAFLLLLGRYRPIDEQDRAQSARIRKFVEENAACFERSNSAGHITGSAWVVDKSGSKVLLTHHKKLNKWLQLGGHVDGNPDVLAAALREAEEESGLKNLKPVSVEIFDVDVHEIPQRSGEPIHYHYDIRFAMRATEDQSFVVSDESNELRWIEIEDIASVSVEESLMRMARKWSKKQEGSPGIIFYGP